MLSQVSFPVRSKGNAPFHRTAFYHYASDWDRFRAYIKNIR